jgi:hypothetical protein
MNKLQFIWILWPSFVVAGIANSIFFTVFDPQDLIAFGEPLRAGRIAVYSMGFFAFWAVTAASNAMSRFLQETEVAGQTNASQPAQRPPG